MKIHRFNPVVDGETVFMIDRPNGSVVRVVDVKNYIQETIKNIQLSNTEKQLKEFKEGQIHILQLMLAELA